MWRLRTDYKFYIIKGLLLLNSLYFEAWHTLCVIPPPPPPPLSPPIILVLLLMPTLAPIRELKQTDAAAERRRSTSKFLFIRTQGQLNSLGPWHHSLFNWMEIWMWPPPLGCRVSLLKLPNEVYSGHHHCLVMGGWSQKGCAMHNNGIS